MGKYFAPPVTSTTPRVLPGRHDGNRLMRHFGSQPSSAAVFMVDGAATATQPASWDDVDRVFYGATIPSAVTTAEASALTTAGFTVIDTDTLTAAAVLHLTSTTPSVSWAGEDWENQGTGGSSYDATYLGTNADVSFTGSGFRIPVAAARGSRANATDDGFTVADAGLLSGSMTTGEWTFSMDFTPLFENPETCRYYRKYTGANILVSGKGLVVESTESVGGFIAAVVSEVVGGFATEGDSWIGRTETGRHQVTLRMSGGRFSVFRGLSKLLDRPVSGSPSDTGDLVIGPGQVVHGLAWWASALSDNEILAVHAASGSVN